MGKKEVKRRLLYYLLIYGYISLVKMCCREKAFILEYIDTTGSIVPRFLKLRQLKRDWLCLWSNIRTKLRFIMTFTSFTNIYHLFIIRYIEIDCRLINLIAYNVDHRLLRFLSYSLKTFGCRLQMRPRINELFY